MDLKRAGFAICTAGVFLFGAPVAHAACLDPDLEHYYYPTIAQDYRDSSRVVVGVATRRHRFRTPDAPDLFDAETYSVRVIEVFKGPKTTRMQFYSSNTTARFPLELGKPYLLFVSRAGGFAAEAPDAFANYNCGQSKLWSAVRPKDRAKLRRLARK